MTLEVSFEAETSAWITAVDAAGEAPTPGRALLMDLVMRRLKSAGAFTWGAGIFVIGETLEATLVNLLFPSVAATKQLGAGALEFVADRYLKSDGVAYVETGVTVGAGGSAPHNRYLQDSAFLAVRQLDGYAESNNRMLGTQNARGFIVPSSSTNHIRLQANSASLIDTEGSSANGNGTYGWIRSSDSAVLVMSDTDVFETVSSTSASISGEGQMRLLRSGVQTSLGKLGWAAFGGAVTLDQWSMMIDTLEWYLREIGATV